MKEKKEWGKLSGRKIMVKKKEKMRQRKSKKTRHFHQRSLQQLKVQKMLLCTFVYLH